MQNKNSKLNTVFLIIIIVLLCVIIFGKSEFIKSDEFSVKNKLENIKEKIGYDNKINTNPVYDQNNNSNIAKPSSIEISLNPWTNADNNKTFTVNKRDKLIVESATYTGGGYKSEDISYDKSMLSLKSKSTAKCEPLVSGCSPSDIFEFVAIKSGTTFIKRSHYQTFSNERIDLAVTIKIN